jgi:hypothetical protein
MPASSGCVSARNSPGSADLDGAGKGFGKGAGNPGTETRLGFQHPGLQARYATISNPMPARIRYHPNRLKV